MQVVGAFQTDPAPSNYDAVIAPSQTATVQSSPTSARWVGVLMLVFVLPSVALAVMFAAGSQLGMTDYPGWAIGTGVFALLIGLWLLLAGIALVRRRPVSSLRTAGFMALAAGLLGILVLLPGSFGNSRLTESSDYSRILLPVACSALLAGVGHVRIARDPKSVAAKPLHALAPLGFVASFIVFVLMIFRVI